MTHDEQCVYLINELLREEDRYRQVGMPDDVQGRKKLLRALMNLRPPRPISDEFLKIQDEYLGEERDAAGIVDVDELPPVAGDGRIVIWQGDITRLNADAIVNAANSSLLGCFTPLHSCIDNIIHSKSGIQLRLACNEIMERQGCSEPTGHAKITPAFNLPSKYVIHTVGPIVGRGPTKSDCEELASCYRSCLELAAENGCRSIAFCCISTGVFHFPNEKAAEIAVETVKDFLSGETTVKRVIFNVFKDPDLEIYRGLLESGE